MVNITCNTTGMDVQSSETVPKYVLFSDFVNLQLKTLKI